MRDCEKPKSCRNLLSAALDLWGLEPRSVTRTLDGAMYGSELSTALKERMEREDVPDTSRYVDAALADTNDLVLRVDNVDFAEDHKDLVLQRIFGVVEAANEVEQGPPPSSPGAGGRHFYVELGVGRLAREHNTRFLRTFHGWRGVLFDSHFWLPEANLEQKEAGPHNIVETLERHKVPREFDLFSLDIDGMDYHVCRALLVSGAFSPRAIIVEHTHGTSEVFIPRPITPTYWLYKRDAPTPTLRLWLYDVRRDVSWWRPVATSRGRGGADVHTIRV